MNQYRVIWSSKYLRNWPFVSYTTANTPEEAERHVKNLIACQSMWLSPDRVQVARVEVVK